MNPVVYTVAVAIMVLTWAGLARFIWRYRPFDLRSHGPAGRHLLVMTWALWALYTVSLVGMVVPIPPLAASVLVLLVLSGICFAVLQRNRLLDTVLTDPEE